jgi:hypothetical protein
VSKSLGPADEKTFISGSGSSKRFNMSISQITNIDL